MLVTQETQARVLLITATAAACLIQVSIAASQTLLVVGSLMLLIFRQRLEFPRIWIPLALFFLWTALADVLSPDPWGGRAQIRKFLVFLFIPLVYGVFKEQFSKVYGLIWAWAVAAGASGLWGLLQFLMKYRKAMTTGQNFYEAYVGRRITGFESHWMTFGALQLSVLSLLLSQCFFGHKKTPRWIFGVIVVLSAAIFLGWTRSIWIATFFSALYLVWFWRPKMMFAVPVVAALAFAVAPSSTRARLTSLIDPHGETDSNEHRVVTFVTGLEMIKAHPWFGLGPEQIGRQFDRYVPAYIKRPLPVGFYGHLHNIYVQYAAERGIPALLLMMWLISLTLWDCVQGIRRLGRAQSTQLFILHGVVACTIGILIGGLFEFNLGDSEVLMMFVSVIGLGYAALKNIAPVADTV